MPEDFTPRITVPDTFDRVTVMVAMRSYVERLTDAVESSRRVGCTDATINMFIDDRDRAQELLNLLSSNR